MRQVRLTTETDFEGWRAAARQLCIEGIPPEAVTWTTADTNSLFATDHSVAATTDVAFSVPREFLELAQAVTLHRHALRFALLYRLLWRLRTEPRLLTDAMDADVHQASLLAAAVRRDIHKMHAFVRFRELSGEPRCLLAWYEPDHHIVDAAAPFFVQRFTNHCWAIVTPQRRAVWDRETLQLGPGGSRHEVPAQDAAETLWREYYASIFNPARLNLGAMQLHMPRKFWRNLPETRLIPQLVSTAHARTLAMIDKSPAVPHRTRRSTPPPEVAPVRSEGTIDALRASARDCRACPLWRHATQTVFGEGPSNARIVLVGEQPGDQEDLQGRPFVGPAGRLLDRAMAQAGLDRSTSYVTNSVKHFKFEPRGKRQLHKKPVEVEIAACHQWLERELAVIEPELIVALGATAARAIFGRATQIEKNRGRILEPAQHGSPWPAAILVTVHPSFLLRMPEEDREAGFERFVTDLALARPYAG